MAYKDPGKEMQQRADALVKAVNSALEAHYKTTKTKKHEQISVSVSTGKGGTARTPAEQVEFVLKGTSWTLNSAHMADGAKHILVKNGNLVTWDLNGIANKQKDAWGVLTKTWNKAMTAQDIRNFTGGKDFAPRSSDPLHMELPDTKLKETDPRVIQALEIYAKATRLEGKAKNLAYENDKGSQFQKDWLKAYDLKLAQAKAAQKAPQKGALPKK
jgi:hypothetical protein